MGNKTLVPALKATVGDWDYYVAVMKYGQVASQVNFAYELGGNKSLNDMIQRGLSSRTTEITEYLLRSEHRFLGALIVACWGGNPEYVSVEMSDPDGLLRDLDDNFGVLTFDGSQQFFALDGQHRLRAIKDAIKKNPELAAEDISVLIVSHFETDSGREKTRRLFTNINRNAKTTTAAENIALDEDDGFSILTRRFLTDDPFLSRDGVVRVFTKIDAETGELKLAGNSVPVSDRKAFSTITVLKDLLEHLAHDIDPSMGINQRPTDDVLEVSYDILSSRLQQLLLACGDIPSKLLDGVDARSVRSPKGAESTGHPFMRPVVQRAVAKTVGHLVHQGVEWQAILDGLKSLDWELGKAPFLAVYSPERNRMITAGENADLLVALLIVHLSPPSRQAVKNARRDFKAIRGANYPLAEDDLAKNVVNPTE